MTLRCRSRHRASLATCLALCLGLLSGCTGTERAATPPPSPQALLIPPPSSASVSGPLLDAGGTCTGAVPNSATAIEPGIGECELVRLKGKPPTDVLVGEGRAGREVQVLYTEPGAKELYFFVNGKLDRVVK